ncbi:NAD(P)/FAD-dependent oxidoreductase [Actinoplanes sp. N902-109]|uniref:FAD-dependent oxidoreductase n=1 Tax=Actinoplanes sp. (strain N902-109) TaxID=649831 RepID=UPI0018DDBE1D|nr:FAD-dependent oxidoreductase [Actinoplanes sp. N902-109]
MGRTRVAIAGAGPTGLWTGLVLARRGHDVTIVDRDPGPAPDGSWDRRGVMQFHHPHGVRQQVVDALDAELPDVKTSMVTAGAEVSTRDGQPAGLRTRRSTFERVLRAAAVAEPGVTLRQGTAEAVLCAGDRAAGLRVSGAELPADLVINATGRAGRLAEDLRAPEEAADCGVSYVSRQYELLPGAEPGEISSPVGLIRRFDGYLAVVFLQDAGTVSVVLTRLSDDAERAGCAFPLRTRRPCARCPSSPTGPTRAVPGRSPVCCPASGCATPTAGNWMSVAGWRCPGWCISATRSAPPTRPPGAASRPRSNRPSA